MLSLYLAKEKVTILDVDYLAMKDELLTLPEKIKGVMTNEEATKEVE